MESTHNSEGDLPDYGAGYRDRAREREQDDREISLGTGTILSIFFALALVCAVFFGFGYSMGRKSVQSAVIAATPQSANSTSGIFSSFKPSAGSPGGSPVPATSSQPKAESLTNAPQDPDAEIVTTPATPSEDNMADSKPVSPPPAIKSSETTASGTRPAATAPVAAMPSINPNGTTMVQVAAVSHQEDADTLVGALKKKGYIVFIRQEPQDHLLHVQLGPFSTHKDADLMRQHLLADGYNAIVK